MCGGGGVCVCVCVCVCLLHADTSSSSRVSRRSISRSFFFGFKVTRQGYELFSRGL